MRHALVFILLTGCTLTEPTPMPADLDSYFQGKPELPWQAIGTSVKNRTIYQIAFGEGKNTTLIFGGFHGDERTAVRVTLNLCHWLAEENRIPEDHRVVIIPILNPDGYLLRTRENANKVDLNRNFPTEDWGDHSIRKKDNPGGHGASEPEARLAMVLVEEINPDKIISVHEPFKVNNYDNIEGKPLAEAMAIHNGYPIKGDIGYPTPGSFGTWAGIEKKIPMVTLEIESGAHAWNKNREALLAAIQH